MDKQPVGQLPDLSQSTNDNEIMVITNPEYNTLQKEKISNLITDFMSKNTDNALIKGTDNKLFVKNYGNADNITEGTINSDLLPESGVTAGTYTTPTNLQVNSKGQITSISEGTASGISQEDIDTVAARPLSDNACTQENFPDEFNYWYNQKYTTFNKGYISTIGTPTMSEFGVISNCGDYDYFLTPSIDVTTADSWEMRFTYTPSGTTPTTAIGLFGSSWLAVSFTTANKITATVNYSGGSLTLTSSGTFATDEKIFGKIRYDSTGYKLYTSLNPFDYGTAATNSQTAKAASAQALKLGNVSATSYLSQGSIDMKYFEFDINGKNVQNYKQTGIDTIIEPNYTVVGSPTITADGVLSNGVIYSDITLASLKNKSWTLSGKFVPSQNGAATVFKFGSDLSYTRALRLTVTTNKEIVLYGTTGTETVNSVIGGWEGFSIGAYNSFFNFEMIFDLNTGIYTLNIITDIGNKTTKKYTPTSTSKELITINEDSDTFIAFGQGNNDDVNMPADAYLDLNSLKLYSNGVLVYQPCLLIPYTETTDGTKIVDAAYYDRVQSCREQTGQALYLTLDEQNQAYFLPQGTVSGMISQNKQKIDELDTTLTADILQAMPVGASIAYEGTTAPDGWFAESGTEIQQSAYPLLYAVVGDKYNLETTQEGYFRLPDTNISSRFYEGSTTPGTLTDAGLPNITAAGTGFGVGLINQISGAAYNSGVNAERIQGGNQDGKRIDFNASRSSSVYGKSTTVQPKSITKFFIIKHD